MAGNRLKELLFYDNKEQGFSFIEISKNKVYFFHAGSGWRGRILNADGKERKTTCLIQCNLVE